MGFLVVVGIVAALAWGHFAERRRQRHFDKYLEQHKDDK